MILRIVHMHCRPDAIEEFLGLFGKHREAIAGSEGCRSLKLIQSQDQTSTISTISIWDSEKDLDAYRRSPLFAEVWPRTKTLFATSPQAESHTILWST